MNNNDNAALMKVAVVYASPVGTGGLGVHAASVIQALALRDVQVHAFGPRPSANWPYGIVPSNIRWYESPVFVQKWRQRYTSLRWNHGRLVFLNSRYLGAWAAKQIGKLRPQICYVFSEIGKEVLNWAVDNGVETVLDSPTTHLRRFRAVREEESQRLCHSSYHGHPDRSMVSRVEREYIMARRIRVSSGLIRDSMIANGLSPDKLFQIGLPVNLNRFKPPPDRASSSGPLRVCFVGSFDLGKGFVYLLRAIRKLGPEHFSLEMVGATGDRCSRHLLAEESRGIILTHGPGDPLPAYIRAEVFVLPSLNDGFGFVAAEAMACGLPVIVTDQCGVAEHVRDGQTGWVVNAGSTDAIAVALDTALAYRKALEPMGRAARQDAIRFAGPECFNLLRKSVLNPLK